MAWTVRTKEGSLRFNKFQELEWAFHNGLIAPNDEIQDPGKTEWRRAGAHPHLRAAKAQKPSRPQYLNGVLLAVLFSLAALVLLAMGYWMLSFAIGLALAFYLLRLNGRMVRGQSYSRSS